ncbi:MAG: MATE family efflux transporter [Clostridiales bacterium]|nr:MATE family efflux transporter [Clostridiales bacterium]
MGILPVGKLIANMSMPPMISMLVAALYNVVDSIFVARVSEDALAAVTLVFPMQMLMIAFNNGVGVGLSSLISRRLGQRRQSEADAAATHGFFLALMLWILYAVIGIFLARPFLGLFVGAGQPQDILDMAVIYFRIVVIGGGFFSFSIVIERCFQSTGNMLYPMVFNLVGCAINTVLAPIFIIGYFGAPALGVTGAGAVAVFGQMITCVIALLLFFRTKTLVHVHFKGFRPRPDILRDILAVAAPTFVMLAVQPVLTAGLNMILITYSTTAVAVLGVFFRTNTFVLLPVLGLNQGALPVIGYNFGAKNRLRVNAAYFTTLRAAFIIMAIGTAAFWIFTPQIMTLFNADAEMLKMGVTALRAISISWVPAAFSIVSVSFFQALAHGTFALVISVVRQLGIILPAAYFLALYFGVDAAWYAYPIAEVSAFILSFIFYRWIRKNEVLRLPDGAPVEGTAHLMPEPV